MVTLLRNARIEASFDENVMKISNLCKKRGSLDEYRALSALVQTMGTISLFPEGFFSVCRSRMIGDNDIMQMYEDR